MTDSQFVASATVAGRYDQLAATYDYQTAQFNEFRRQVVSALSLRPGDTVLDVGCGTGLCFPFIQERIGPMGTLIGVEPCPAMIEKAMGRSTEHEWGNVTLVNAAAEDLNIPAAADAMLFCATHDVLSSPQALSTVFRHARPGARVAATGGKWAAPWLWPLNLLAVQLQAPFVSSFDGFDRPWRHLAAYCSELAVRPIAWGIGFLATGTAAGMIPPSIASRHGAAPRGV